LLDIGKIDGICAIIGNRNVTKIYIGVNQQRRLLVTIARSKRLDKAITLYIMVQLMHLFLLKQ
jgi:hypothetical protein